MSDEGSGFERELSEQLGRLADQAPQAPSLARIQGKIRQIQRQRLARTLFFPIAAAAASVILILLFGFRPSPQPQRLKGSPPPVVRKEVEHPGLEPIPRNADPATVETLLRDYLDARKVGDCLFEKEPGGDVAIAIVNGQAHSPDRVAEEVSVLFQHYDFASVEQRNTILHFSLVAR